MQYDVKCVSLKGAELEYIQKSPDGRGIWSLIKCTLRKTKITIGNMVVRRPPSFWKGLFSGASCEFQGEVSNFMAKILHHLRLKPWNLWDKLPTSTGAGFQPSTVSPLQKMKWTINFISNSGRAIFSFSNFLFWTISMSTKPRTTPNKYPLKMTNQFRSRT